MEVQNLPRLCWQENDLERSIATIWSHLVRVKVTAQVKAPRNCWRVLRNLQVPAPRELPENSTEQSVQASDEPSSARPCSSTTCQRRAKAKELYLHGKSRKPYRKGKNLSSSFEDSDLSGSTPSNPIMSVHFEPSEWNDDVCKSCDPVLMKYSPRLARE